MDLPELVEAFVVRREIVRQSFGLLQRGFSLSLTIGIRFFDLAHRGFALFHQPPGFLVLVFQIGGLASHAVDLDGVQLALDYQNR